MATRGCCNMINERQKWSNTLSVQTNYCPTKSDRHPESHLSIFPRLSHSSPFPSLPAVVDPQPYLG